MKKFEAITYASLLLSFHCITATAQSSAMNIETQRPIKVSVPFTPSPDARYRLYPTQNNWTFLELDTATGRLWQAQFSVSEAPTARFVLNAVELASGATKPGRFTLYETRNHWNFLLLDQTDGRVWQAQFSVEDPEHAGLFPLRDAVAAPSKPMTDSAPNDSGE